MAATYEVHAQGDPPVLVIALTGQIDREALGALTEAYDTVHASGSDPVLLDFTAVDYINSTGIALIVGLLGRARADDRPVMATGLTDHYQRIFAITRLSDFIAVYPDVDAALTGTARP
jgi:anti-sigma B factor antagonist